jgi:hypothetical protein
MRTIYGVLLITVMAMASSAQTAAPPIQFELVNDPGGPIEMRSMELDSTDVKHPVIKLIAQNVSQKTILAGVFNRVGPGNSHSVTATHWGITFTPGQTRQLRMSTGGRAEGTGTGAIRVDFVLFEDATSWGEDKLGESERIRGYYEGKKAAASEIKALVEANDVAKLEEIFAIDYRKTPPPIVTGKENLKRHRGITSGYASGMMMLARDYKQRGIEGVKWRLQDTKSWY